ncbi:MAG TPA: putative porin [Vicinamibacteria bacterium]|nr:putative porin [Vicinamibacteria bacterium]
MKLRLLLPMLAAVPALAPAQDQVFQPEKKLRLTAEGLFRQEWTTHLFAGAPDVDRQRGRLLAGAALTLGKVELGAGGDFNYSSDVNVVPSQPIIRDNYDSRDARVDLAYARLDAGWIDVAAGRFDMPIAFTEMVWDRDLRAQGGALTLAVRDRGALQRLALTALGARGSHVFDDDDTTMLSGAVDATVALDESWRLQLVGSFVTFQDPGKLEPKIRRQNTRVAGAIVNDYDVVDAIVRLRRTGPFPIQLVADGCLNTAVDDRNRGLWLALVAGSTLTSHVRLEYVYAFVDPDATLGAYPTDDFFWTTGWQGHKADLGVGIGSHLALHAVGSVQRFKDSPRVEERSNWVRRLRLEARVKR